MVTWNDDGFDEKNNSKLAGVTRPRHKAGSSLTVKHSAAILSGGGQGFAGVVQFVAVVPDADLKLDWFTRVLDHGGAVEDCTETELPPPLVFLLCGENRV